MKVNILEGWLIIALCLMSFIYAKPFLGKLKKNEASKNDRNKYFSKFGYMNDETPGSNDDEKLVNSIKTFQEMLQLPVTGIVDKNTHKWMESKRCGESDVELVKNKLRKKRPKRYTQLKEGGWSKSNITYRIINTATKQSDDSVDASQVHQAIDRAFQAWASASTLTFTKVSTEPVDIDILFGTYDHCASSNFDGTGPVLAHAFRPGIKYKNYGGNVHFDDSEIWTLDIANSDGLDLFQVAVHEIGHSLGLGHSSVKESIMAPYYIYRQPWSLKQVDIEGIRSLYGSVTTTVAPNDDLPNFCTDPSFDAIVADMYRQMFVFKGKYYAKMSKNGINTGYPRLIQQDFPELPSNIDAAVHGPMLVKNVCSYTPTKEKQCTQVVIEESVLYLFKNNMYYYYSPGLLSSDHFKGSGTVTSKFGSDLPSDFDSVFSLRGAKFYFTKGSTVWRVTRGKNIPSVDTAYPKILSETFVGLPENGINAGLHIYYRVENKVKYSNYFFTGFQYYEFVFQSGSSTLVSADPTYPRPSAQWWFKCLSANELNRSNYTYVNVTTSDIEPPLVIDETEEISADE